MLRKFALLFIVIIHFNCGSEDPADNALLNTNIDPEFLPYVESFIEEARARNLRISFQFTGLEVKFGIVKESEDAIGFCSRDDFSIKVLQEAWENLSENHKEVLIFHELGHCKMQREHKTDLLSNGEVASIMWPGIQGKFFGKRRDYYIDELYSGKTREPEWASIKADYSETFERQSVASMSSSTRINQNIKIDTNRDFEIEFEMENNSDGRTGLAWGSNDFEKAVFITTRAPKQFDIETGKKLIGRVYSDPFSNFTYADENKITIRKTGEDYFFFINETFVFWMEFLEFDNNFFQTFTARNDGTVNNDEEVKISNFKVSYLSK